MGMSGLSSCVMRFLGATALVIAALVVYGCGDVHSRSDFTSAVLNKSAQEVRTTIGKPDAVDEHSPERVAWTYNHATYDLEHQNKMDSKAVVVFKRDPGGQMKAIDVLFE